MEANENVTTQMTNETQEQKPKKQPIDPEIYKSQLENCNRFFNRVADLLRDTHEVIGSRHKTWNSCMLIPKGTEKQVSYYGKPVNSLRVACNWNWRASLKKCNDAKFIQCVTPDLPYVRPRPKDAPENASPPIWANMVGYFGDDHKYHCVFGERYNHETGGWIWDSSKTPEQVAKMMREYIPKEDPNAQQMVKPKEDPQKEPEPISET